MPPTTRASTRPSSRHRCPARSSCCRAAELKAAFGMFYKEDKYEYAASPVASVFLPDGRPDIQGFSASDDIQGDDHNLDIYVELLVPLLKDVPGVSSFETVLGYRVSDYASAGSFDAWKAELLYQPVDGIRVRGSYQNAIRAASVLELYQPQLPTLFDTDDSFFGIVDPCKAGSEQRSGPDAARVEALCVEQGVPAALLPDFEPREVALGVAGGNPDLGSEEATTTTPGRGLDLSPVASARVEPATLARLVPHRHRRQD